jgi:hypothetical protein
MDKKRLYISVDETLVPIQDKEARARQMQARMQAGRMFFSYASADKPDHVLEMEREMLRFPNGINDDIVDMLAWGGRMALKVSLPSSSKAKKRKGWMDEISPGAKSDGTTHMAA